MNTIIFASVLLQQAVCLSPQLVVTEITSVSTAVVNLTAVHFESPEALRPHFLYLALFQNALLPSVVLY